MGEAPQFHGSDLELIEKHYGIPRGRIVSFSANINPLGISPMLRKSIVANVDAIMTYPDRQYTDLRESISAYCGVPVGQVLVGSGVTELISRFIRQIEAHRVMLINPTYSEYAREVGLSGGHIEAYQLPEDDEFRIDVERFCGMLDDSFDLVMLCNPNNPTGSVIERDDLRAILHRCEELRIHVMVDETYVEFARDVEAITAVPLASEYDNLIVLRGVSKFFAAPGLRLGYAIIGNAAIREQIDFSEIPWAINSLAATSGGRMFEDTEYIHRTAEFIDGERGRLLGILEREPGLHVFQPSANFILMRILKAGVTSQMVFEHAIRDGLMLRDCSSFPGLGDDHIRFCFCLPEQNDRLIARIRETLE